MTSPVLIELTRGSIIECRHRGVLAVADHRDTVLACGNVCEPVFPRSAIKALQCLPVVMSGAADRFALSERELAFCCASHSGTEVHADCAAGILARLGLGDSDLVCGPHLPLADSAAHAMLRANREPHRCHNNCSGKHAGMLATAVHNGEPVADYHLPDHPVQRRIRDVLEDMVGVELGQQHLGTDGCSVPNWALPLDKLAVCFARYVSGHDLAPAYREAALRIVQACWKHPHMVAGPGRLDTILMERFGGDVFVKTGADGVYCGGVKSLGLGFALKIEDGAKRAAEAVVSNLLGLLLDGAGDLAAAKPITNWRGTVVGEIRAGDELASAVRRLAADVRRR